MTARTFKIILQPWYDLMFFQQLQFLIWELQNFWVWCNVKYVMLPLLFEFSAFFLSLHMALLMVINVWSLDGLPIQRNTFWTIQIIYGISLPHFSFKILHPKDIVSKKRLHRDPLLQLPCYLSSKPFQNLISFCANCGVLVCSMRIPVQIEKVVQRLSMVGFGV